MTVDMKPGTAAEKAVPPDMIEVDKGMATVLKKLARYQSALKTVAAAALVLLATVLIGLGVQFVYTLPLLIIVPLAAQLWCRRSLPVLITGFVGAALFAHFGTVNFINWRALTIFSFASIAVGVACGLLISWAIKQAGTKRVVLAAAAGVLLVAGCFVSARYTGTPFTYIHTYTTVSAYMKKTYTNRPLITFYFNSVDVDRGGFWHQYTGEPRVAYSYVIEGFTSGPTAPINIYLNKIKNTSSGADLISEETWKLFTSTQGYHEEIDDGYITDVLAQTFDSEQITHVSTYICAAFDFDPSIQVGGGMDGSPAELSQLREEYLNYYAAEQPLSPEIARKKTALLDSHLELKIWWIVPDSEVVTYKRNGATFTDDSVYLSKAELIKRATTIYKVLLKYDLPYKDVWISAGLAGKESTHVQQSVEFTRGDSLAKMLASYSVRQD